MNLALHSGYQRRANNLWAVRNPVCPYSQVRAGCRCLQACAQAWVHLLQTSVWTVIARLCLLQIQQYPATPVHVLQAGRCM